MKHSKFLISIFLMVLLSGCANSDASSSSEQPYTPFQCSFNVTIGGMLREGAQYLTSFNYNDSYFCKSAKEKDDELRNLSFASSIVASDKYNVKKLFDDIHFDTTISFNLDNATQDSIGYSFSHRKINDFDLISVAIRGFDYNQEWANNLLIGETGNHQGFDDKSNDIYNSLKDYLLVYKRNIKIWISGYSRSGAVANCLASKLLKERNDIVINEDDLFVYTFEAPRSVCKDNSIEYQNVWNYLNSTDLIVNILPSEYELYRCGREIVMDKEVDIEAKIKKLDKDIVFPTFIPTPDIQDEKEFINYIIKNLLKKVSDETISLHDRKAYFDNYQLHISYLLSLLFSSKNVQNAFKQKFLNLTALEISNIINNNLLYESIYPIFDEYHITYDSIKLNESCKCICNLIKAKQSFFLELLTNKNKSNNIKRVISMHYPDVVLALIR